MWGDGGAPSPCAFRETMQKEERDALVREIAEFVRTKNIECGDQLASCVMPSPDASILAEAIEERFLTA